MQRVRLIGDANEAAKTLESGIRSASRIWIATAWAADGTPASRALWAARNRIEALVVGLDFHQTDPAFLRRFRSYAHVHAVADGTFHPKLYLLQKGTSYTCLVGSSNFTWGGLGANLESNVLLDGSTRDRFFRELVDFVEAARDRGRLMTAEDVDAYAQAARKLARHVTAARTTRTLTRHASTVPRFDLNWADYVRQLERTVRRNRLELYPGGDRDGLGYLGVVESVQALFAKHRKLAAMSPADRKKVAGTAHGYGYFGRMVGAGKFNHLMNERPTTLDAALKHIPARPAPVSLRAFEAFVKHLPEPGVGVAVASRLLAMKRPDVFLCVDSANRRSLSQHLGFPSSRMAAWPGYYELHQRIWQLSWFKSPRPTGVQRRLWDARVALIDALHYEPR